ncbi:NADH-quinone oxidoreductase subunit L [Actinomyces sp. zg-332]|uniref:NADH-quinone oxidoreductase subunit L n=1 Tax=Actinomyces sp. zg-332 TaxID=2708340 RepID=UPI001421C366|nr:NADH-quinone oxidoreductase subunit L [Actinomyces sp. zg-332]QPK94013.1 NADH-quinone oxidoreductase subunit L [Actinomyces sp. zg-332]
MITTQILEKYSQATGLTNYIGLVILVPFISALLLLVLARRVDKYGHILACMASGISAIIGIGTLIHFMFLPTAERVQQITYFDWINVDKINLSFAFLVDPLSLIFLVLVTFVGFLIHVYSIAYMEHDRDRRRFFAYLNLFIAAMLILILADSYTLLFVGWEGVGLTSYLLIGFWNHDVNNAKAAKKAFVMNRVGDAGLLVAMMAILAFTGSLNYSEVFTSNMSMTQASIIGVFLLMGACGKSAQLPLQAWLGDAMAGPTPVSALIHAATMVTAGVYLVVRSAPIYVLTPTVTLVVAIVGAATLVFGAVVGCAKTDMKKVLAASTMSQIGYMMLAAGLGPVGYAFAIFHLFTHGFFKAQLFLGAGSVMHAMNDDVEIFNFGGLSKYMKITWVTFAIGWLAILGVPPLSGFWSKDKIIEAAFMSANHGETFAWIFGFVALVGAGVTAFYMSRLFFMIFHGKERFTYTQSHGVDNKNAHSPVTSDTAVDNAVEKGIHNATLTRTYSPHESNILMWLPMVILSVFSVFLGMVLSYNSLLVSWFEPVLGHAKHSEPVLPVPVITVLTLLSVIIGLGIAYITYVKSRVVAPANKLLAVVARNDFYQDEINNRLIVLPFMGITKLIGYADKGIDVLIDLLATGCVKIGEIISKTQNGYIRQYVAYIFVTFVVLFAVLLGIGI